MKKALYAMTLLLVVASCKFAVNEIKKTAKIRKAAKEVCECKWVGVESDFEKGNASVTITVRRSTSEDRLITAGNIMTAVQDSFPKICNYSQIFIIFEGDEFDEQFTYWGCDGDPDRDTLYYEDFISDDEWDTFMEEDSIR